MIVKVFYKDGCAKCPKALELAQCLQETGIRVSLLDVSSTQGLTQSIYHDVMSTPSIVVTDSREMEIARYNDEVPSIYAIQELNRFVEVNKL